MTHVTLSTKNLSPKIHYFLNVHHVTQDKNKKFKTQNLQSARIDRVQKLQPKFSNSRGMVRASSETI
ncbi:unnamed protein product [Lupinus luteus]|uniref:Uncharacterized protein n=1 Tax=Lupinus luteus TaxID=3873 RepID=A0AAV1Y9J4_LUPLU